MTSKELPLGEIVENLNAPEVYCTSAALYSAVAGVLTVTLLSSRFDNSVAPAVRKQVVVGRLSMPVGAAADLATALYTFLSEAGFKFVKAAEKERMQ